MSEARAARDAALARVERASPALWRRHALDAVKRCARQYREFTTDDVWEALGWPPREPRALGAIMRRAQELRLCEPTCMTAPSSRTECHARPVRIWRSLIYGGD